MSARETYRPPQAPAAELQAQKSTTTILSPAAAAAAGLDPAGTVASRPVVNFRRREYDTADRRMHYVCESCAKDNAFRANEHYRCRHCGHWIMFKPRPKK